MTLDKELDSIIAKLLDWVECDEYHVHDGTGEHEGSTPLPHDFNDDEAKSALKKLINDARVEELKNIADKTNVENRGGFIADRLIELFREGKDI